jgi:hypothetical protein
MNLALVWARRPKKLGGGGPCMTSCPNCDRIYNPLAKLEDWGVAVNGQAGQKTSFTICGDCLNDPASIDMSKIIRHLNATRSNPSEALQGIIHLENLKSGNVTAEQIAFCRT